MSLSAFSSFGELNRKYSVVKQTADVLVSWSCDSNVSQTEWLSQRNVCFNKPIEIGSCQYSFHQAQTCKGLNNTLLSCNLLWLQLLSGYASITPISSSVLPGDPLPVPLSFHVRFPSQLDYIRRNFILQNGHTHRDQGLGLENIFQGKEKHNSTQYSTQKEKSD